jgi:hypothetical protein
VLAAILLAGLLVAMLILPWVIWRRGTLVAMLHGLVVLPGLLWGIHRSWYATVRGIDPPDRDWPFASQRVAGAYTAIVFVVSLFAAQLNR